MSKRENYLEYINDNILPLIDYAKLGESYNTDMAYAKGVLNCLHEAMVEVYGSEQLVEEDGDEEGFVVVPGVLRGMNTGNLCVALFSIDLTGGGELWGTYFLCAEGVVSQDDESKADIWKPRYIPYNYCHTADIPCDTYSKRNQLPDELTAILSDFRNHHVELEVEDDGDGDGNAPSYEKYHKAAEQGNATAQFNLGVCYEHGAGVAQDFAKAVEWYTKAAKQGDAQAQYNLALCHYQGNGTERDLTEAIWWLREAEANGVAQAQQALGMLRDAGLLKEEENDDDGRHDAHV